mgnify:CR=1 FL=1
MLGDRARHGHGLQTAIRQTGEYKGKTVAYGIANTAQKYNEDVKGLGSVGLIIGGIGAPCLK